MNRLRAERTVTAALLLIALILRGGSLWFSGANLVQDRDGYLGIAQNLLDGNGYAEAEFNRPTAYRPPLYPVLLAGLGLVADWTISIAAMHLAAGVATVFLTLWIGRQLGLGRASYLAGALVAVDPLLVQYTAYPMTETVFTLLVTSFLAAGLLAKGGTRATEAPATVSANQRRWREALVGVVFGLCALCRPTIWLFAVFVGILWIARAVASRDARQRGLKEIPRRRFAGAMLLATALTVCVWPIRNWAVFGKPILTTTHGGYTFLLGNNPIFYNDVVVRPWGTVWGSLSLKVWQRPLHMKTDSQGVPIQSELQRDRSMYNRAWRNISQEQGRFCQACWLRVRRFWNIAPQGPAAKAIPGWAWWMVTTFYSLVLLGMLVGIFRLRKSEWSDWFPLLLLIVSFTAVHSVYWSNMRMRAPLVPVIALLAARGLASKSTTIPRPVFCRP